MMIKPRTCCHSDSAKKNTTISPHVTATLKALQFENENFPLIKKHYFFIGIIKIKLNLLKKII